MQQFHIFILNKIGHDRTGLFGPTLVVAVAGCPFNNKPSAFSASAAGLGVCGQVLEILKKHSMEKDISVAVTSPTRIKGKVFYYAIAEYSRTTGEFEWKPYKGK